MGSHFIGEIAALCTAALWTTCSILFASAGRRIGAFSVNALRIALAVILLAGAHLIRQGTIIPAANDTQWLYLALSGIIGLALGDLCYFSSLVMIGPRRGVLLMSIAPIFSAITAYLLLREVLGLWSIIGIVTTLSGVTIVILESEEASGESPVSRRRKTLGTFLGLGGALGQGIGLVIAKYGMFAAADDPGTPLDPLSATLIRMIGGAAFIWVAVLLTGRTREVLNSFANRAAVTRTVGGAVSGPFLGVWLSMIAVSYTLAGVAATLMSLMPVMVIPFVWVLYKQRTSRRGTLGALIAVGGVAILLLL